MAGAHAGTGASSASVPACVEPLCGNPRWAVARRGERVAVSSYCLEHATQAMFGALADEDETSECDSERDPDAIFREEVRRQRVARESRS
jgi:hypothetical protein